MVCQSDFNRGVITSGGGISDLYRAAGKSTSSIPDWQKAHVTGYFSSVSSPPAPGYQTIGKWNCYYNAFICCASKLGRLTGRGYPDVSLLGATYITYINGSRVVLYGTSASTPVFAGMVSLVNSVRQAAGNSSLGWLNPALYAFSKEFLLNDITSGNNLCKAEKAGTFSCCSQGFYAAPGWDPVTGLGSVSPDF